MKPLSQCRQPMRADMILGSLGSTATDLAASHTLARAGAGPGGWASQRGKPPARRRTGAVMPIALLVAITACSDSSDKNKDAMADLVKPDTRAVANEPFGRICDFKNEVGQKCTDKDILGFDLYCVQLTGSTSGKGFCTRQCSDVGTECYLTPNGQMAGCYISTSTSDDSGTAPKYCGFICKSSKGDYDCPPTLKCGTVDSQGNAFCKP